MKKNKNKQTINNPSAGEETRQPVIKPPLCEVAVKSIELHTAPVSKVRHLWILNCDKTHLQAVVDGGAPFSNFPFNF